MNLTTVFFGLGGVLTPDPYATILAHEELALGRSVGLSPEELGERVGEVWFKYATLPTSLESDFWHEISETLGVSIEPEEAGQINNQITTPSSEAVAALEFVAGRKLKIGIISDNTSFFYTNQANLLELSHFAAEELIFLSHEQKLTKAGGLYEFVARLTSNPAAALVVDNDPRHLERAAAAGFQTMQYELAGPDSLSASTSAVLGPVSLVDALKFRLSDAGPAQH